MAIASQMCLKFRSNLPSLVANWTKGFREESQYRAPSFVALSPFEPFKSSQFEWPLLTTLPFRVQSFVLQTGKFAGESVAEQAEQVSGHAW
jgi:hypothetical protein